MTESETETETLERIETALRKIAGAVAQPKAAAPGIDRAALAQSLDLIITRLKDGLEPPRPTPTES